MPHDGIFTLLIVDDHAVLRESLSDYIRGHCPEVVRVVAQAGNGEAAVLEAKTHRPHFILMDIEMPKLDGIRAIRQIRDVSPESHIVVFSMHEDAAHVVSALRAGARDYLFKKDATAKEVVGSLLRSVGSEQPLPVPPHSPLFHQVRDADSSPKARVSLTGAEIEILKLLALKGLSHKEISGALGGPEAGWTEAMTRKHAEDAQKKLGARSVLHAATLAMKGGFFNFEDAQPSP